MPRGLKAALVEPAYRLLPVDDLTGGLDHRRAPTNLKDDRSRQLRNWSIQTPGELTAFPGWSSFSTASLGSGRGQGGKRIYLGGVTPFMLAAWNGGMYQPSDAGVWGAAVSTGWSTANEIDLVYDRDLVAIFDAATAAKKSVDGTTWTTFGIAAPLVAPTGIGLAGGTLTPASTYEFSFSGRDDALLHEGNESPTVQVSPGGANGSVRLTIPRHPDTTHVDTLIVYVRDVTAGEKLRRRYGTVANPAGATVTFDVTANTWGSGVEAPTDHTVPPLLAFGVVWKNRWWARHATVTNRLHFSQVFENQSWPSTFYIDIPFERGDSITALLPLGDTLVVFGQTKVFLVIGQTSLDFEVRPSGASQAGALGFRAICALEDGALHAAAEGIYLFDGATDRLLSNDIDTPEESRGWRKYITTASATVLAKTPVVYHQHRKEVGVAVSNLYPFGAAGEYILDLNRTRLQEVPGWTTTDRTIGGYIVWDGPEPTAGNRGRIFSWSDTIGKLYEERTGTDADGADMVCDYEGATFTFGGRTMQVTETFIECEPHSGNLGCEVLIDGASLGAQNVDLSGGFSVYGTDVYGTAHYGGANRVMRTLVWDLNDGNTLTTRLRYTGQETMKVYTYQHGVMPEMAMNGV
jgi:hypothetical protein